jgi:hypothetical protein
MDDRVYRLAGDYSLYRAEVGEGSQYFLFNIKDGTIYRLNEVSFTMLSLFDGNKGLTAVFDRLKNIYDTDETKLHNDLNRMLTEWRTRDILLPIG